MRNLIFIILLSAGLTAQAQQKAEPAKGFWVIESNRSSPKNQTVKFYNINQQLLYQEHYNLNVLNCSRKRIRTMLDGVLTTVLAADSTSKVVVLANLIKRKPNPIIK